MSFMYNILYQNSSPTKIILELFSWHTVIFAYQILNI